MHTDTVRRNPGSPDKAVGHTNQVDGHPTLTVAAPLRVGLLPFHRKADGYFFKHSLRLHAKEDIHQNYEGGELKLLLESRLDIIIIILLLCRLNTLLWRPFPVG